MPRNLASLDRDISPPPVRSGKISAGCQVDSPKDKSSASSLAVAKHSSNELTSTSAAIEAGRIEIRDHLEYFCHQFALVTEKAQCPSLSLQQYRDLYLRNCHDRGRHFVVHQHDHPVSGVHYDLRLQFSASSSLSFAIPYGLPGNANSSRPNRMAIETRVHNLWNNLIESASHVTGSLLIWDTGEYEVLPRFDKRPPVTDDDQSDTDSEADRASVSHNDLLVQAFRARHIRLRLHGTRLPPGYTIKLRLPSANAHSEQPRAPKRKRRRVDPATKPKHVQVETSSDDDPLSPRLTSAEPSSAAATDEIADASSDGENEPAEAAAIRVNNAYPGADNTIGSIHQRHWFLTLDRANSGFRKQRSGPDAGRWVGTWPPFVVRGRDHERSVVTGRSADEVMEDEGVDGFVGRKMWRPIVE